MNKYDKLKNFLAGYFHEDWVMDGEEPAEIVQLFIQDSTPAALQDVIRQIELYVRDKGDGLNDTDLLRDLGCYYGPGADDIGAAEWLLQTARLLKEAQ